MDNEKIYSKAKQRVAEVFAVPEAELSGESRFGSDLQGSFVSSFKYNELDQILHDIRDVAIKSIAEEIEKGCLMIATVDDNCEHMVRCYEENPQGVSSILKLSCVELLCLWFT